MGIRSLDAVKIKEAKKGFKEGMISKHKEFGRVQKKSSTREINKSKGPRNNMALAGSWGCQPGGHRASDTELEVWKSIQEFLGILQQTTAELSPDVVRRAS